MKSSTSNHVETHGQMGAWAPYYDLLMKVITLGREKALRKMTVDVAGVKAGDKVLEVGCGTGTLSLVIQETVGQSGKVYGIDAAPEMIERAQRKNKRAGKNVNFQIGLIDSIPYSDNEFDVAMCSFMIFHMPHDVRHRGLKEIFRVLKKDGKLLIVDILKQESINELQQLMEEAGFIKITNEKRKFSILYSGLIFVQGITHKV